ncbi:MAG: hypothetical protein ACOX7W_03490 [Christensenellales bacterium]
MAGMLFGRDRCDDDSNFIWIIILIIILICSGCLGGIGSGCDHKGFLGGLFDGGNEWLIILVIILLLVSSDSSCGVCKES